MHPALSIIVFTTASGAGYGLLALLGLLAPAGILPDDRWFGGVALALALGLIAGGLLCSTAHLGRPERAWRGITQWRSSWLSREAVASIATFIPAGIFGIAWVIFGRLDGPVAVAGLLSAAGAVITVSATAMIYASLKPIPQWASRYTLPGYLIFSAMSGAVLLNALVHLFGTPSLAVSLLALLLIVIGWGWKAATWRYNADAPLPVTTGDATGLGDGRLRTVEWPHTEANYLLKEMSYRIARKHSLKLRRIVMICAFALPLILTLGVTVLAGPEAAVLAVAAVLLQAPAMLVERWLFFAEAKHVVSLYYMPEESAQMA